MEKIVYDNLAKLNNKELDDLASEIRKKIIDACSKNGGHLGSSLGVVEVIIALHASFDFPKDKIIFDVGHQAYAHKILSGRDLNSLRQKGGVSGFQKMSESEFDPYDAGHSSTSISAAMGLAYARDLSKDDYNVIAFIGDSSISNGLSFEALNQINDFNHKIIIVLNDNNMSISSTNGSFHKAFNGTNANIFEELGIRFIGPLDGYDYDALKLAFKEAKESKTSVIINVSTIKGKGYKYSEMDDDGFWHGVEPFNIETGKPLNTIPDNKASWSKIYARGLEQLMEIDEKAIIITPATTIGSYLRRIMMRFKDRAFDVGISEEHAVVLANALALSGFHPFISIYSTFLQRAYDEILHDNARMNTGITYLIDRSGLVGKDGETHQGIYDVAMLASIPNISIVMAKDEVQALNLLKFASNFNKPLFIRYSKEITDYSAFALPSVTNITYGKWELVKMGGSDICLVTMGEKVNEFLEEDITLINAIWLRPLDREMSDLAFSHKNLIIYDPFSTYNGLAKEITNYAFITKTSCNIITKTIPNDFIPQGKVIELEQDLGISVGQIKDLIKSMK